MLAPIRYRRTLLARHRQIDDQSGEAILMTYSEQSQRERALTRHHGGSFRKGKAARICVCTCVRARLDKNGEQSNNGNFHFCRFRCNELPRARTQEKKGERSAAERNAINVEMQAFRNLTYNAAPRALD